MCARAQSSYPNQYQSQSRTHVWTCLRHTYSRVCVYVSEVCLEGSVSVVAMATSLDLLKSS